jgi:hypothetical protein
MRRQGILPQRLGVSFANCAKTSQSFDDHFVLRGGLRSRTFSVDEAFIDLFAWLPIGYYRSIPGISG